MNNYYLMALNAIPMMGCQSLRVLLSHYNQDAEECFEDYRNWHNLPIRDVSNLIDARQTIDAERIYNEYLKAEASCVSLFDKDYPQLLKNIYDPPILLFYKGVLPSADELCIAMVGSRHATAYGRLAGEMLAEGIAAKGISVVSGMARGIDAVCHQAALKEGGKTYAILGSGVDVIYPRENEKLYREIIEHGAVISEYACGSVPLPKHFPMRNRIISGISKGVVVVEAGEKSGTLITVENAISQNRDIFTVPGPITGSQSKGTNGLINRGCKVVTCAKDIWEEYITEQSVNYGLRKSAPVQNLSEEERSIAELLVLPLQFDALAAQTGFNSAELAAKLTVMEIKGIIKQLPGKYYCCNINI